LEEKKQYFYPGKPWNFAFSESWKTVLTSCAKPVIILSCCIFHLHLRLHFIVRGLRSLDF